MKTVVILQARFTSTRLPGKVLKKVNGITILEWVIRSSRMINGVDEVCVAIPAGSAHELVSAEAKRLGAPVVTGPEEDVLQRFVIAARSTSAKLVMRITTDCPLADPAVCQQVLDALLLNGAEYSCNNEPFTFPHGLDCEVFTLEALEAAHKNATIPYDREHVTPWMKREPSLRKAYVAGPGGEMAKWRWTVDTPEDLEFFKAVASTFSYPPHWREVSAVLEANPELHNINRISRQR